MITWGLFQTSIFLLGFLLQKENIELSTLNKLGYTVYISRGAGMCLNVTTFLLILPVCNHLITFLRNKIPIISNIIPRYSIYFHKICAYTLLFFALIHVYCHYLNFYGLQNTLRIDSMYNLHYTKLSGISGHLMLISIFFIFVFSGIYFRKYKYEIFWYFHHFFILFFIVYPFHGLGCVVKTNNGICKPYYSIYFNLPIIIIYILERIYRETRPLINILNYTFNVENNILKIYIKKTFNYMPGQYLLINCPEINKFQWHAFTISSSNLIEEKYIEITIKCLGDWTQELYEKIRENKITLKIKVDGAFSSVIDTISKYDSTILIASGIGITPYISVLRHIKNEYLHNNLILKKIDLIWVNRDINEFNWFNTELLELEKIIPINILQFHIYATNIHNIDINKIKLIYNDIHHLNNVYKTNIYINFGRPDFDRIFYNYTIQNKELNVGCFVCSNNNIVKIIKEICIKYTNNNIKFNFISENFDK